jgi:hypothetical protein
MNDGGVNLDEQTGPRERDDFRLTANLAAFLLSDESSYIAGAEIAP